jgi:hypothetical protein
MCLLLSWIAEAVDSSAFLSVFDSGLVDFRVRVACRLCDGCLASLLDLTGVTAFSVWTAATPAGSATLPVARIGPAKPSKSPAAMINAERPLAPMLMTISLRYVGSLTGNRNARSGHIGAKKGNFSTTTDQTAVKAPK